MFWPKFVAGLCVCLSFFFPLISDTIIFFTACAKVSWRMIWIIGTLKVDTFELRIWEMRWCESCISFRICDKVWQVVTTSLLFVLVVDALIQVSWPLSHWQLWEKERTKMDPQLLRRLTRSRISCLCPGQPKDPSWYGPCSWKWRRLRTLRFSLGNGQREKWVIEQINKYSFLTDPQPIEHLWQHEDCSLQAYGVAHLPAAIRAGAKHHGGSCKIENQIIHCQPYLLH